MTTPIARVRQFVRHAQCNNCGMPNPILTDIVLLLELFDAQQDAMYSPWGRAMGPILEKRDAALAALEREEEGT